MKYQDEEEVKKHEDWTESKKIKNLIRELSHVRGAKGHK